MVVPLPPLKLPSEGSQAISPAAAMTGSPPVVIGVEVLVGLGIGLAVNVGTEVEVGVVLGLLVTVAGGEVGETTAVEPDVGVGAMFVTDGCAV